MRLTHLTLGAAAHVELKVYDPTDTLTDVTGLTCRVKKPNGTYVSPDPTVVHDGLGTYHAVFTPDAVGIWGYKFVSPSPGALVDEGIFQVNASRFS